MNFNDIFIVIRIHGDWTWVISHVPNITQPLGISGLLDGYIISGDVPYIPRMEQLPTNYGKLPCLIMENPLFLWSFSS